MDLSGVVAVIPTPFRPDETVSEECLRRAVDFAIRAGAKAVCAPAFGSECYKLTDEERQRVAAVVVEQADRRVPVFISTGSGSARSTMEFSRYSESLGAQGIMVAAPRVVALGPAELTRFYDVVCASVGIPVMIQDADFAGSGLAASFIASLAERCSNFLFAKLENPLAGAKCAEILRLTQQRLQVLYGWGGLSLLDGLAHGAVGVMPGTALTPLYARVMSLYRFGRKGEARSLFNQIVPLLSFSLQHLELFILMEKRLLLRRGVIRCDRLREPTLQLDEAYRVQIEELCETANDLVNDCLAQCAPP